MVFATMTRRNLNIVGRGNKQFMYKLSTIFRLILKLSAVKSSLSTFMTGAVELNALQGM